MHHCITFKSTPLRNDTREFRDVRLMYPELLVRSSQGGRVPANMHRLHVALVIRNIRQFILQLGRASAFRDWHNFEASTNQSRTPQEPPSCETTLLKPRGEKTLYSSASKCSRFNGLILRDSTLRYWFWLEQYDTVTTLSKPGSKKKLHGFGDSTTLSSCLKRHCSKKPLGISWGTAQLFRASTVLSVPKKQGWSQSFRTVPEHKMERCVHVGGGGLSFVYVPAMYPCTSTCLPVQPIYLDCGYETCTGRTTTSSSCGSQTSSKSFWPMGYLGGS